MTRRERADPVGAMRVLPGHDPGSMTLRRFTVAHPFGTIAAWMGAARFPTRRLQGVRPKTALDLPACSFERRVGLIGIRLLLAAIPGRGHPDGRESREPAPQRAPA